METAHRIGRGRVHFGAPLTLAGTVNMAAYGARWGSNWANYPPAAGQLRMPPGRFVGNAKGLSLVPQVESLNVPDYTGLGEGEHAEIVQGVQGSVTLLGFGGRNLVDALSGGLSSAVGGAVSETVAVGGASIDAGSMLFLDGAADTGAAMTAAPSWGLAWTENVHWAREAFGIRLLQGFAAPLGATIAIGYTKEGGAETVEAFAQAQVELGMVYVGTNVVDGRPERADAYRVLIKPSEAIDLINEGAAEIKLSFTLKPVRPTGATRVRWFRIMRGGVNG